MINVTQMFKAGTQLLSDNAPVLLTAFGAVGVVGTAILTGKASFEAADKINTELMTASDEYNETEITTMSKVKLVWPLYVPAVTTGVLSVAAIVLSHRVSSGRAAALAAAYALNEGKLEEYQDKIKEKFGIKKEKEARDDLTQDQVNRDYREGEVYFSPTDGKVLIREDYTGRFFWSSIEDVKHAANMINARINDKKERSARISDFYDLIGLSHVSTSDYFGWTEDEPLALDWNTSTTPDGLTAVHTFEYTNHPVMNPEREAGFR